MAEELANARTYQALATRLEKARIAIDDSGSFVFFKWEGGDWKMVKDGLTRREALDLYNVETKLT